MPKPSSGFGCKFQWSRAGRKGANRSTKDQFASAAVAPGSILADASLGRTLAGSLLPHIPANLRQAHTDMLLHSANTIVQLTQVPLAWLRRHC